MSITRLSSTNRSRIKHVFLFFYCSTCFLLNWWIGWVLLLLIVPARASPDVIERERRMHVGQDTIKRICCRPDLNPGVRRSIGGQRPVHRLLPPPHHISD